MTEFKVINTVLNQVNTFNSVDSVIAYLHTEDLDDYTILIDGSKVIKPEAPDVVMLKEQLEVQTKSMKLFIHDEKHEQVIGEMELGQLSENEEKLIEKVINFLQTITDRYKRLVLGKGYEINYDEDGEPMVIFD